MMQLSDLKIGDVLIADGARPCIKTGTEVAVKKDRDGTLYVECSKGWHYLRNEIVFGFKLKLKAA